MRLLLLVILVMVSACKDTQADSDVGLYDPKAPEGSAFVRFINLENSEITPEVNGEMYDVLGKGHVSSYFVFAEGEVDIHIDDYTFTTDVQADGFYTVVNKRGITALKDQANESRSKATIAFYNFSTISLLTLKARKGSVEVLKDVSKSQTLARDMNAAKIDFSIYEGDNKLLSLSSEVIERGNHYSIIYDGVTARMVTATTNTRK